MSRLERVCSAQWRPQAADVGTRSGHAIRLVTGTEKVIDVAFAAGFGDLSTFNHTFRREFGTNPAATAHCANYC